MKTWISIAVFLLTASTCAIYFVCDQYDYIRGIPVCAQGHYVTVCQ